MFLLRLLIGFVIIAQFSACHNLQKKPRFVLEKGDLLFQDLDSDSISDAIETVTGGVDKLSFSHVGIIDINENGDTLVLEAISKGVSYTKLDSFLSRSLNQNGKPKVEVGRLKPEFKSLIQQGLAKGKDLIGLPYDDVYVIGDSNYYCSELIYEMFVNSKDSIEMFKLNPMTFKDAQTGDYMPFWLDYYKKLGVEIPEGKPGLNPNGMSLSANINMVYSYHSENKY